ncbi:hypothetical protein [Maritalea sp. S77]|uniref:hypothetical protein n=1 Tax=Maritalea sp. S77 TaxID=3415125 RepID=UPI003C7BB844
MKAKLFGMLENMGRGILCVALLMPSLSSTSSFAQSSTLSGPMAAQMQHAVEQYEHDHNSLYSSGLRMQLQDLLVMPASEIDALDRDLQRAAQSCSMATYDQLWQDRNKKILIQISTALAGWEQLEQHINRSRDEWQDSFLTLRRAMAQIPILSETLAQEFVDESGALSPFQHWTPIFGIEADESQSYADYNQELRSKYTEIFRGGLDDILEALPGQENALLRGVYDTFHQQSFSRLMEQQEGATAQDRKIAAYLADEQQRFLRDYDGDLADFDKRLAADIEALYRVFKAAQNIYEQYALSPIVYPFSCAQPQNYCPIDYEWLGRSHYESVQAKLRAKFDVGQPYELTAHADRLDGYLDQVVREEGRRMADLLTGLVENAGEDGDNPLSVSRERNETNPDSTDLLVPQGIGAKSEDVQRLVSQILNLPSQEQERVLSYFQALADETATVRRAIYEERVKEGIADPIAAFEAGEIGPFAALREVQERARAELTKAGVPLQPEINISETGNDEFGLNSGDILAGIIGGVRSYETLNEEIRVELQARALAEEALRREVKLYGGVRSHSFNPETGTSFDATVKVPQTAHDSAIASYLERPEWMEAAYAELSAHTMRKRREGRAWLEQAIPGVLPNQGNVTSIANDDTEQVDSPSNNDNVLQHGGIELSSPPPVGQKLQTNEIVLPEFVAPSFDLPAFPSGGIEPSTDQSVGPNDDIFADSGHSSSAAPSKEILKDIFSNVFPKEDARRVKAGLDQLTDGFVAQLQEERGRLDEIRADALRDVASLDENETRQLVSTLIDSILEHQERVRAIDARLEEASSQLDINSEPDLSALLDQAPAEVCEPPSDFDIAKRAYYAALNAFKVQHKAPIFDRAKQLEGNLTSFDFSQYMATKEKFCETYRGGDPVKSCGYQLIRPRVGFADASNTAPTGIPDYAFDHILSVAGYGVASVWKSGKSNPLHTLQVHFPSGDHDNQGIFHAEANAVEAAFEILEESARPTDGFVISNPGPFFENGGRFIVRDEVKTEFAAVLKSYDAFLKAHARLRVHRSKPPHSSGLYLEAPSAFDLSVLKMHPQDLLDQMEASNATQVFVSHQAGGVEFPYETADFDGYALLARGALSTELISNLWARVPDDRIKSRIASQLLGQTYWLFCDEASEYTASFRCRIIVPTVDVWTYHATGRDPDQFRIEATDMLNTALTFAAYLEGVD